MNENVKVIFGLIGGLALFLYGMNSMSDALQKAAGEKMKKILEFLTKNPIMGALAGALVTAVLQSSSATTVMVIGFVSAGLMSLPQAISVIFGANIGTTMTAQLMAFKITDYIYPIIFIGFMMNFVCKKERVKNIGTVIFSFGLLFEGIEIMGSVMKPLANSPVFIDLMGRVSDIPVLGVVLGAVMTLVVQSSSATIAVLQNFASQAGPDGVTSVIGLAGAIPILLGDNIGTTITALLASIGQSKNAKRTAIAHSIFNISGSIVFLFLIPWFAKFIQFISPKGAEVDVIPRQIANAHTTFNVVCTLIWLPLIPVMVKIVTTIIRGDDRTAAEACKPVYLDNNVIDQPVAAMCLVSQELERLADYGTAMLSEVKVSLVSEKNTEEQQIVEKSISDVAHLGQSISEYITRMLGSGTLTEAQSEQTAGLLFVTNSIQRVADRCQDIHRLDAMIGQGDKNLSVEAKGDLRECVSVIQQLFEKAVQSVKEGNTMVARDVFRDKDALRKIQRRCKKAHLSRIKKKKCASELTEYFSEILDNLERMADSCAEIAEEAIDNIAFVVLEEDARRTNTPDIGGLKEA